MRSTFERGARRGLLLAIAAAAVLAVMAGPSEAAARWVSGDIHTHTYLTDGSSPFGDLVRNAFSVYGLDYVANSEHGGTSAKDTIGAAFVTPVWRWLTLSNYSFPLVVSAREAYPERRVIQGMEWNAPTHEHVSVGVLGADNEPSAISNFEYRFDAADLDTSRAGEGTAAITHKESDPVTGLPITVVDVPAQAFDKHNVTNDDMLYAVDWLEQNYGAESYAIVNHPSRKNLWHVGDFRAMNDAAPDVAFGFEGLPGHQAAPARGEYGNYFDASGNLLATSFAIAAAPDGATETGTTVTVTTKTPHGLLAGDSVTIAGVAVTGYNGKVTVVDVPSPTTFTYTSATSGLAASGAGTVGLNFIPHADDPAMDDNFRTYGGADKMTADVGGLWDALLGEGRNWWVFNNSDYHVISTASKDAAGTTIGLTYQDFWPGQYAKTWTHVNRFTNAGIVNGMRSGNVFVANGDLINGLRYTVTDGTHSATMGGTLNTMAGKKVKITISVKSPRVNSNGDPVRLNHIDVIRGDVTGLIPASDPAYTTSATNPSTKVVKTFAKANWKVVNGWKVMSFTTTATKDMYFRLRGTDWAKSTPTQTDAKGNPLVDWKDYVDYPNPADGGLTMLHGNTPDNAWADLWFYANPVFVNVK
jgi:hypothetical protein